jgi:hypothetical protein
MAAIDDNLPASIFERVQRRLAQAWRPKPTPQPVDPEARLTAMAAAITKAHVASNQLPPDEIPTILRRVRAELAELQAAEAAAAPPTEAPETAAEAVATPRAAWLAMDRGAVLLIGVAIGVAIGAAFVREGARSTATPPAAVVAAAGAAPAVPKAAFVGQDCPAPFSPHLLRTLAAGKPVTVAVFGDSFGVGVFAAMHEMLPKTDFQVIKFSRESTGFTRYGSLNLEDAMRGQIAAQPVDIAVVDFGANDTQGIYDGSHAYPLLSEGWKQAYGARMDRYVNLLRAQGTMVYWMGLPKMRKPDFDSQIAGMNAFYAQRMAALGVPYVGVEPLSVDAKGEFNQYLPDGPGQAPKQMRANDGIHMTFAGYERISAPVVERIQDYVARARVAAQVDAAAPATDHAS